MLLMFIFYFFLAENYFEIFREVEEDHQARKEEDSNQEFWDSDWWFPRRAIRVRAGFEILLQQWEFCSEFFECLSATLLWPVSCNDREGLSLQSSATNWSISWRDVFLVADRCFNLPKELWIFLWVCRFPWPNWKALEHPSCKNCTAFRCFCLLFLLFFFSGNHCNSIQAVFVDKKHDPWSSWPHKKFIKEVLVVWWINCFTPNGYRKICQDFWCLWNWWHQFSPHKVHPQLPKNQCSVQTWCNDQALHKIRVHKISRYSCLRGTYCPKIHIFM